MEAGMTRYKFVPGSIASYMDVLVDDKRYSCVYLSKERGVVVGTTDVPLAKMGWPIEVQACINRHFGVVFSLRHEDWKGPGESPRAQFLRNILPWSLDL
jgi:hypothetical protein